jgi:hypothetical protein
LEFWNPFTPEQGKSGWGGGIAVMERTELIIAPTGMRLHEWIALERGYFDVGIEPVVRWAPSSARIHALSGWRICPTFRSRCSCALVSQGRAI